MPQQKYLNACNNVVKGDYNNEKMEKLERDIDGIRERFGKDSVVRCRQLEGEPLGIYSSFGKIVV